jgi:tetratricopeptide (TPR) repeat protein
MSTERSPDFEQYQRGLILQRNGNHQDALRCFYRSMELSPHFKTCQRIAQSLRALGQLDESDSYIEKAFQLNPNNSQAATEYAEMLANHANMDQAMAILDEVLRKNTSYGPAQRLKQSIVESKFG